MAVNSQSPLDKGGRGMDGDVETRRGKRSYGYRISHISYLISHIAYRDTCIVILIKKIK